MPLERAQAALRRRSRHLEVRLTSSDVRLHNCDGIAVRVVERANGYGADGLGLHGELLGLEDHIEPSEGVRDDGDVGAGTAKGPCLVQQGP